jgi:hypothetical protein
LHDSPLEEAVTSEPVSETRSPNFGADSGAIVEQSGAYNDVFALGFARKRCLLPAALPFRAPDVKPRHPVCFAGFMRWSAVEFTVYKRAGRSDLSSIERQKSKSSQAVGGQKPRPGIYRADVEPK